MARVEHRAYIRYDEAVNEGGFLQPCVYAVCSVCMSVFARPIWGQHEGSIRRALTLLTQAGGCGGEYHYAEELEGGRDSAAVHSASTAEGVLEELMSAIEPFEAAYRLAVGPRTRDETALRSVLPASSPTVEHLRRLVRAAQRLKSYASRT